jgi:hypothetical protein
MCISFIATTDSSTDAAEQHSVNVFVDPRIELLAVVQSLGDYGEQTGRLTWDDFPYKRDVMEYFSPYKDHPAVKLFKEEAREPGSRLSGHSSFPDLARCFYPDT